jgi:hypothetical protein
VAAEAYDWDDRGRTTEVAEAIFLIVAVAFAARIVITAAHVRNWWLASGTAVGALGAYALTIAAHVAPVRALTGPRPRQVWPVRSASPH